MERVIVRRNLRGKDENLGLWANKVSFGVTHQAQWFDFTKSGKTRWTAGVLPKMVKVTSGVADLLKIVNWRGGTTGTKGSGHTKKILQQSNNQGRVWPDDNSWRTQRGVWPHKRNVAKRVLTWRQKFAEQGLTWHHKYALAQNRVLCHKKKSGDTIKCNSWHNKWFSGTKIENPVQEFFLN